MLYNVRHSASFGSELWSCFARRGSFNQPACTSYLTLPFILYNLPVQQKSAMAEGMPAEVVEQLVPIVWREKWEPMKPFLLE